MLRVLSEKAAIERIPIGLPILHVEVHGGIELTLLLCHLLTLEFGVQVAEFFLECESLLL